MLRPLHFLTLAALFAGSAAVARDAAAVAGNGPMPADGSARLPRVAPESVGMSVSRLAMIDDVVYRGIRAGGFPGAAVIVARHGGIVWERGYGTLDWRSGVAVDPERTMYDLASLTKVAATTAAAMVLVDQGKLRLDERVTHYLPTFAGGAKEQVTIRDLLTHRSGLPAGRDVYARGRARSARNAVLATSLVRAPGAEYEYSDLGLDVMGFVIERITHQPLDQFVQRTVYAPLGMRSTMFRPASWLAGASLPQRQLSPAARCMTPPRARWAVWRGTRDCFPRQVTSPCSLSSCSMEASRGARDSSPTALPAPLRSPVRDGAGLDGKRVREMEAAVTICRHARSDTPGSLGHRCGSIQSATLSSSCSPTGFTDAPLVV